LEAELEKLRQFNHSASTGSTGTELSSDLESPTRASFTRGGSKLSFFGYLGMLGLVCLVICMMGGGMDDVFTTLKNGKNNFMGKGSVPNLGGQARNLQEVHFPPVPSNSVHLIKPFHERLGIFKYIFDPLRLAFLDTHDDIHTNVLAKNNLFRDPKENMTKTVQGNKITLSDAFDVEEMSLPVLYDEKSNFVSYEEMKSDIKTTIICPGSYEVSENANEFGMESNLLNSGDLHLVFPMKGHNLLSENHVHTLDSPENEERYVEIYAKVYFVREIELGRTI